MRKVVDLQTGWYDIDAHRIDYAPLSLGAIPDDDYPVSFESDGTVRSVFGDHHWDLTPYDNFGRESMLYLPFWSEAKKTELMSTLNAQSRWFLHLMIEDAKPDLLAIGSLKNNVTGLCSMAKFALANKISLINLLEDWSWMHLYIETDPGGMAFRTMTTLLGALRKIPPSILGFRPVGAVARAALQQQLARYKDNSLQHPPIPYRILSQMISTFTDYVRDFEEVSDRYLALVRECNKDLVTGRRPESQNRNKRTREVPQDLFPKTRGESMESLLARFDLEDYFVRNNLSIDVGGLSTGLYTVQLVIKFLLHIYSGMRDMEVTTLPLDCLDTSTSAGKKHYLIVGDTTKLAPDGIERVRWVTSIEGYRAAQCAQKIADCLYKEACGEDYKERLKNERLYLLVAPSYLNFSGGRPSKGELPRFRGRHNTPERFKSMMPTIQEEDLRELEKIDPNRNWRSEDKFRIGQLWPISSHQLRRSLALYAHRSGLVSLPALRRQLKHITEAMSQYYANGSAFATDFIGGDKEHFGHDWRSGAPVSAALSYEFNVLGATSQLFGGHIHWLNHRRSDENGVIAMERSELQKRVKKGEMAYRETILGGCTSTTFCDHASIEIFSTECLNGCAHLVGNVENLRNMVAAQTLFVAKLAPGTNEHTMEKRELAALKKALADVEE